MTKEDLIKWKKSISEMYKKKYYTLFVYDSKWLDNVSYNVAEFEGLKRSPKTAAEEFSKFFEKVILSAAAYSDIDMDKVFIDIYPYLITETPIEDVFGGKEYKFEDNLVSFTTTVYYEKDGFRDEITDAMFRNDYDAKIEGSKKFFEEYETPIIVTKYDEFFEEMKKLGYEFNNHPFSDLVDAANGVINNKKNSDSYALEVGEIECTIEFEKETTPKM